jgi:dTDP-4-dehydrorhamnose reductase
MQFLITGSGGNLARGLMPVLQTQKSELILTDSNPSHLKLSNFLEMDVSDFAQVQNVFQKYQPELVFHLAALTDVDYCELHPQEAFQVNALGTKNVALACQKRNIPLVYISTGQVFDGTKQTPYVESDLPLPINIYGQSKWEGEKAVQTLLEKYFIIRIAWLVGGGKEDHKFVGKMVQKLQTQKQIQVVQDKIGSPTFVEELVPKVLELVQTNSYGLYHLCNQGSCSRYEMAKAIQRILGKSDVDMVPVSSDQFPLTAPRGRFEVLVSEKLGALGIQPMPHWEQSLKKYLENL